MEYHDGLDYTPKPVYCKFGLEKVEVQTGGDAEEASGKPVILVVEDNADVRRYICEPLEVDYSVVEAMDGEDGIEKAKSIIPDLIVSDIMMPGRDGYELVFIENHPQRRMKKTIEITILPRQ